MNKKVSVIISTYNRAIYIERAIQSILSQTYKNIEIIVVDDNNENSVARAEMIEKMKKYDKNNKVIYLKHKVNKNGAAARNTGISYATGDYITFLDDDDYFFPDRISKLVKKIKDSSCDAIYTGFIIVKNKKILNISDAIKNGNLQLDILKQNSFFGTGSNMFFKTSILREIHGFDESFLRNQDLEVFVRFFRKYKIDNINEVLVVKNIDDRSNGSDFNKIFNSRIHFLDTFEKDIKRFPISQQKDIYITNFLDLCRFAVKDNNKLKKLRMIYKKMGYYDIKFSVIETMKILMYIFNSYIPLKKAFDYIKMLHSESIVDKELVKQIKEYEKL